MGNGFTRLYVMLRPVRGAGCGYARMEAQGSQGRMSLHLSGLPQGTPMLRALLFSGDPETGAALDLGLTQPTPGGRAFLRAEPLTLPPGTTLTDFHSLAVAVDWPEAQLLLWGPLNERNAPPVWQLQEALRRYLTVPPCAPPAKKPPAEDPQATLLTLEKGTPPARPAAWRLPTLLWPEAWQELQPYFLRLPPFAPFDAPGWRFVQVKLPQGSPGPWCAVGYHARGGRVQRVAYAVPAGDAASPPPQLADYTAATGRHGERFWLRLLP